MARDFEATEFLPEKVLTRLTQLRIENPDLPRRVSLKRRRRRKISPDGRLTLLAVDHPGRMVTGIRDEPLRMGRRLELLSRASRVLACSPFDGVVGTSDVFDELFMLERLMGGRSMLDRKVMLGSMNRGGLAGTSFELDDPVTGYDPQGIVSMRLDGGKFLLRFDPEDERSAKTLGYCAEAVRECTRRKLPIFVEPLPVIRKDGKVQTDNNREKLVKLVGAASALGSSSSRVWLKLPYCEGFEEVAAATTLPIVLLGGEASDDVHRLLREIEASMRAEPNVRGVLMGRNLLYPPGGDPLPLAMAVHTMVHEGKGADEALSSMKSWSGKDLDVFPSND